MKRAVEYAKKYNQDQEKIKLIALTHDLGHCVYTLNNSKDLPFFDRDEYPAYRLLASPAFSPKMR